VAGERREATDIFQHPPKLEELSLDQIWALVVINQFIQQGIKYIYLSPGLRNYPLIWAATALKGVELNVGVDERAVAFMALSHAKVTGTPSLLISTSGSAAANYLPAVIEAKQDRIPLIIISAARPDDQALGHANQALSQGALFSGQTRAEYDFGLPNLRTSLSTVRSTTSYLITQSVIPTGGVVHINAPYGDPLTVSPCSDSTLQQELGQLLKRTAKDISVATYQGRGVDQHRCEKLAAQMEDSLVIVGRLPSHRSYPLLSELLQKINGLHLIDITSSLSFSSPSGFPSLDHPNLKNYFLNHPPKRVIHFGGAVTAKGYYQLLSQLDPEQTELITVNDNTDLEDPAHRVSERIIAPVEEVAKHLLTYYTPSTERFSCPCASFKRQVAEMLSDSRSPFNSYQAIRTILSLLPSPGNLLLGNSLAIRIFDRLSFLSPKLESMRVVTQRGASGIEGGVASACGVADGSKEPTTAIIGDISALHDLNSLALLAQSENPVILIIINNSQGGIFSDLPIQHYEQVRQVMTTPHGWDFKGAASMFGLNYHQIDDYKSLSQHYLNATVGKKSCLLELKVSSEVDNQVAQKIKKIPI
jgi:2-succinyl-5-enolpyruvyl-6-hydroxy-3-cyclohexene-1-carboxylate synthase